jgi:hypothetical protein
MNLEPLPLQNIRQAFQGIAYRVNVALRTQRGDAQHLNAEQDDVSYFLEHTMQVGRFVVTISPFWLIALASGKYPG